MGDRYQREMDEVVRDRIVHLTDVLPTTNAKDGSTRSSYGYNLAVWETVVIVDSNATSAFTIYLPPVAEAKGKIYTFSITTLTNNVTIEDLADDSIDFAGQVLTASADRVAYYSDGFSWWNICDMTT